VAAADGVALAAGRAIAAGRVATGLGLLLAPRPLSRAWIGDLGPGAEAVTRALGARDLVMGAITLHTISHPQVGPRWVATCALTDAVDGAATWAARAALPRAGAVGVPVLAVGAAVAGLGVSAMLRGRAKRLAEGYKAPIVVVPKDRFTKE
jgi:hypothetical protein